MNKIIPILIVIVVVVLYFLFKSPKTIPNGVPGTILSNVPSNVSNRLVNSILNDTPSSSIPNDLTRNVPNTTTRNILNDISNNNNNDTLSQISTSPAVPNTRPLPIPIPQPSAPQVPMIPVPMPTLSDPQPIIPIPILQPSPPQVDPKYPPTCKDAKTSPWFKSILSLNPKDWTSDQRNSGIRNLQTVRKIGENHCIQSNEGLSRWVDKCVTTTIGPMWSDGSPIIDSKQPPTCADAKISNYFRNLFARKPTTWTADERNVVIHALQTMWKIGANHGAQSNDTLSRWVNGCVATPGIPVWSNGSPMKDPMFPPTCADAKISPWFNKVLGMNTKDWTSGHRNVVIYNLNDVWKIGTNHKTQSNDVLSRWVNDCHV